MNKGQFNLWVAIVGAIGMLGASAITSFVTSNVKISVLEEREENHYEEVQKQLGMMDKKLDKILEDKVPSLIQKK